MFGKSMKISVVLVVVVAVVVVVATNSLSTDQGFQGLLRKELIFGGLFWLHFRKTFFSFRIPFKYNYEKL